MIGKTEFFAEEMLTFSSHGRFLHKHGLYSAALFYKNLNESPERRFARVTRYVLENLSMPEYRDGQLFPISCGASLYRPAQGDDARGYGLWFDIDGNCVFNESAFRGLYDKCENSVERYVVDSVIANCRAANADIATFRFNHGGTHNVVDMDFVLNHGISAYRSRIEKLLSTTSDPEKRMFGEGMLDVLAGTEHFVERYQAYLKELLADYDGNREILRRLAEALEQVPLRPARNFYEAYVSCGMAMALSGNFEPGRIDAYLYPFYAGDLAAGKTSPEEALALLRAMFVDINEGLGHPGVTHVTIGGTYADGSACYNALTVLCIRAIAGLRTPNVTLRVRKDMPEEVWNAALENIGKGHAQPALVNEDLFLDKLVSDYDVPFADAVNYVFGGCSEVLIQGKTMCDSTWVQYNMLDIFEHTLYNHFLTCDSFDAFLARFKEDVAVTLKHLERDINNRQLAVGANLPFMMKCLLVEGCIENGRSFTAGGAVYNFDSTNLYAGTNTINSLYTLKAYYDGKLGDFSREEMLRALIANFEGHDRLFAKCKNVTKFGNFDPELNALAHDVMEYTFSHVMELRCWRRNDGYVGRYMPSVILWVDWMSSGARVGATPDGRHLGDATADCCGPMQGTDREGPTAVMGAALALGQDKCAGTCVLNLRLDRANFRSPEMVKKVRQLLEVYFRQGGSQLQINVVDPATLLEAYREPEKHRDLVVRVGGFSDNFVMLDRAMQREILKRTEYQI